MDTDEHSTNKCLQTMVRTKPCHVHRIKIPNIRLDYPREFIQGEIDKLKYNVSNVFYDKPLKKSCQELYTLVENLCTLNQEDDLFEDLRVIIREYLNLQLMDLLCYKELTFLVRLKNLWLHFSHKARKVRNIYLFMEKCTRVIVQERKGSIVQLCDDAFRVLILQDQRIKQRISYLFNIIDADRQQEPIDEKLVEEVVAMLSKLELYEEYFENDYLRTTQAFYKLYRDILFAGDPIEYFYYVQVHMVEEKIRALSYFQPETEQKIFMVLYKVLIEEKLTELMNNLYVNNIFDAEDINDIITVYHLLKLLPKANADFCKIFEAYILTKGQAMVEDMVNESNFVANLLRFRERIDAIMQACFKDSQLYIEAVRISFKTFINHRKYKPAQCLAKFIDGKMRDKQIPEDLLDKIMVIFRCVHGKDVFEAYYKRYLAKRLLLGKSSSQDAEKYMIGKLKQECGDTFTSKLEGMFRDMDLSQNLVLGFKQKNSKISIDFSTVILTNSFWPTFTKFKVTLPDHMLYYQSLYHDFYKSKFNGRSLEWISSLDTCLLKATFNKAPKELRVSLFQGLVLLLFNNSENVSFKTMYEHIELDSSELRRTLSSLINPKSEILKIVNLSFTNHTDLLHLIEDDTEFAINEQFTNKLFRIKINQLQYKNTEEEQQITEEEVLHDRHLQIDAAVVRLMKQCQKMKHNELISTIFTVLTFPVTPNDLKKRIEILIERDFLSRCPEDPNMYLYVA